MTTSRNHTPLETFLLYREVLQLGLTGEAFLKVAEYLQHNDFVKKQSTYDPSRLTQDSLQELFLRILREELKTEIETATWPDGGLSPTSKKRKLQHPNVPTLQEARRHAEKVPPLVKKLRKAYVEEGIREIQEYGDRLAKARAVIEELEELEAAQLESEGEKSETSQTNGRPEASVSRGALSRNGRSPSAPPAPPTRAAQSNQRARETKQNSRAERVSKKRPSPLKPSAPPIQLPASQSHQSDQERPEDLGSPHGGSSVLQAPKGLPSFEPRHVLPPATQAPPEQPRPGKSRQPTASSPVQPQGPDLKWEPPYQPGRLLQAAQRPPQPAQPRGLVLSPNPQNTRPMQAQQQHLHGGAQPPHPILAAPNTGQFGIPVPPSLSPRPTVIQDMHTQHRQQAAPLGPGLAQVRLSAGSVVPSRQRPVTTASPSPPFLSAPDQAVPHQQLYQAQHHATAPNLDVALHVADQAGVSPTLSAQDQPQQVCSHAHYPQVPPHSNLPVHVQAFVQGTPYALAAARNQSMPRTPANQGFYRRGSSTKWRSVPTPSTPRMTNGPGTCSVNFDILPSPAFEPLSPDMRPIEPELATPQANKTSRVSVSKWRARPAKTGPQTNAVSALVPKPPGNPPGSAQTSAMNVPAVDDLSVTAIKEEMTSHLPPEAGDTMADESIAETRHVSRAGKRKRRDSSPGPVTTPLQTPVDTVDKNSHATAPSKVNWTRSFHKISGTAMDQIIHHKSANMFALPVREKDAPGYRKSILQTQDLKSIRAAINQGNKAATQTASTLLNGDPGLSSVSLPLSADLLPPKGIINSAQLECELAHMFANAIMYNPEQRPGIPESFLCEVEQEDDQEDADTPAGEPMGDGSAVLGYKVDEFGVVKAARDMWDEVRKLVKELRWAEQQRAVAGVPGGSVPGTRHGSVATSTAGGGGTVGAREASAGRDGRLADEGITSSVMGDDNVDDQTAESEAGNMAKRRRTSRKVAAD